MAKGKKKSRKTESTNSSGVTLIESGGRVAVAVPFDDDSYGRMVSEHRNVDVFEAEDKLWMGIFKKEPVLSEAYNLPVGEDADQADWKPDGTDYLLNSAERIDLLDKVRWLCKYQPHCFRALKLYENYVLGSGLSVELVPSDTDDSDDDEVSDADKKVIRQAKKAWTTFLKANRRWWSIKEFGRRVWRDGEQFSRKFPDQWPPRLRFIDPECIADPSSKDANPDLDRRGESDGIATDPNDVTKVISYREINIVTGEEVVKHEADDIFHTVIDVDSTEKRGCSRFTSAVKASNQFASFIDTEIIARKLQASIVLHRKVSGGSGNVTSVTDAARTGSTIYPERTLNREKIRPGTIINTNRNVDLEFLSPSTNYQDATPLARQMLLCVVSATGFSEHMVTGDGSNANQASAIVQEGSVDKMVRAEQEFMEDELQEVYEWVMEKAIDAGEVSGVSKEDLFERFDTRWVFPDTVARDHLKDAQTVNLYRMMGAISQTESSRRAGADPVQMKREMKVEMDEMPGLIASNPMNPTLDDKLASSASNAQKGSGGNQGKGDPIQHRDKM